jgi:hypothetical protein
MEEILTSEGCNPIRSEVAVVMDKLGRVSDDIWVVVNCQCY